MDAGAVGIGPRTGGTARVGSGGDGVPGGETRPPRAVVGACCLTSGTLLRSAGRDSATRGAAGTGRTSTCRRAVGAGRDGATGREATLDSSASTSP